MPTSSAPRYRRRAGASFSRSASRFPRFAVRSLAICRTLYAARYSMSASAARTFASCLVWLFPDLHTIDH
ncbi:hypothetical protein ACU4HD_10260 [Cupriavidus basilensis]